jgi:hypothetical protein
MSDSERQRRIKKAFSELYYSVNPAGPDDTKKNYPVLSRQRAGRD